ncbi:MAG: CCR4-NOT transcription complex subunit 4, MOT2 [Amphiamblys sp. WSBS2006]|nr:MAG: CCR4-NOT transcription complex subunit 4, MOT2 [Amphiamblys sp. WSBS2006]
MEEYPESTAKHLFDSVMVCPLCTEKMDYSDKNLQPCICGHQVCLFCYHQLKERSNGVCPKCKRLYKEMSPEHLVPVAKLKTLKQEYEERKGGKDRGRDEKTFLTPVSKARDSRRHLSDLRVIQRTLVYAIGIDIALGTEQILEREEYFGQFGEIVKVVINTRNLAGASTGIAVYVTYKNEDDAERAIAHIDGSVYEGRVIRATYGTTKYCSFFLRGMPCPNSDCMYLHDVGRPEKSYTKEQMAVSTHQLHSYVVDKKAAQERRRFGEVFPKEGEKPEPVSEETVSEFFGVPIIAKTPSRQQSKFNPFSGIFPLTADQISRDRTKIIIEASNTGKEPERESPEKRTGVIGSHLKR